MKAIKEMTQQELNEKVQAILEKGCKLPIEKIEAIVLKSNKASLKAAKKFDGKQNQRNLSGSIDASKLPTIGEMMRENALKNLPSSMR